jgi:hypothetical protein
LQRTHDVGKLAHWIGHAVSFQPCLCREKSF